ncbi:MAG: hypothetical protein WC389_04840 [Lutibacter sp.]|jgi:hypothetical protein
MKNRLLIIMLLFIGSVGFETFAQGDLLITPNRVVFEGRKQKEALNLINTGKETTTYTVSFVQRRMNEDGSFSIIETPDEGQLFADPYLRIYPRQVTLEPGEAQVVLLQFKRTAAMQDGEYRSHLYFRSEKDYTPLGTEKKDTLKTLAVELIPIYGISIPIIIRIGEVNASATLSDLKLEKKQDLSLSFTLNRTGNSSLYGNFIIEYVPLQGKPYKIGAMNGVAVYTNLNKRFLSIKLNAAPALDLKSGKIKLRYISRDDAKKQEVFAEAELEL